MLKLLQMSHMHLRVWGWLMQHPFEKPSSHPDLKDNGGFIKSPLNNCWACEFAGQQYETHCNNSILPPMSICDLCPFDWIQVESCIRDDSYYHKWFGAKSAKDKMHWAKKIRDLKFKSCYLPLLKTELEEKENDRYNLRCM